MHRFHLDRIGAALPVAAARDELARAAARGAMVVTAPPGTGKTTFVPPLLANLLAERAGLGAGPPTRAHATPGVNQEAAAGTVLLMQPRRVAVRAAARRLAQLDGSELGHAVGFTVRGERQVSVHTRVEALTPGVLLRRLITDPELTGVGAVVLDEVHERSVESDLLLGMLAETRELRDDLLVVAMSATIDTERFADVLGGAPVVQVPSPLHPLHIDYAPFDGSRLDERGVTRGYLAHLASVTAAAQADAAQAAARDSKRDDAPAPDALVFVPGTREVDALVRLLRERVVDGRAGGIPVEVLPLHGRLPAREQDRAVRGRVPGEAPRIIVSTALAESSLTVPGVRLVIDAGFSREVRRDRGRDMAGLVTVSASRESAQQRAGRAARQGPGRAIRVYSESEFARMPMAAQPEISSADLVDAALLLAAWGTPEGRGLPLPSAPPEAAMRDAVRVLRALALVDEAGGITRLGREVAALPVGAREARALIAGAAALGNPRQAAEVVAAASGEYRETGSSLPVLLRGLRDGRVPGADRWRRESKRLDAIARGYAHSAEPQTEHSVVSAELGAADAAGIVCALARPEWVARRTSEQSRSYLLASGSRAAIPEGSELAGSEWLAVREVQRADGRVADGTGAVIRLAAPLTEAHALEIAAPLIVSERRAEMVDGRVRVRLDRRVGAILCASTPVAPDAADTARAFAAHLREAGLGALNWHEAATALRGRLTLLYRTHGEPWPAVDDDALVRRLDEWLGPDLGTLKPASSLHTIDVTNALRRLLPWPEAARLDELAPAHLTVPSGSRIVIDYPLPGSAQEQPVVAVKLQEVFGLAETPRLADGREGVLFHLLSPGRRPLAITADLASFWDGPYRQVRAEMRGRYPKHPWPEDPWRAQATARTTRRMREG